MQHCQFHFVALHSLVIPIPLPYWNEVAEGTATVLMLARAGIGRFHVVDSRASWLMKYALAHAKSVQLLVTTAILEAANKNYM